MKKLLHTLSANKHSLFRSFICWIFCFISNYHVHAQCTIVSNTSGTIYNASMTNSVNYTATITGAGSFYTWDAADYCGFDSPNMNIPWSGNTNALSYVTYTFSGQITSVDIFIAGAGMEGLVLPEKFVFTTNGSTPTLTVDPGSCAAWAVTGNQTISPSIAGGLNSIVKVTSDIPFTTLTIKSGWNSGSNGGSGYGLCNTSMITTGIEQLDANKLTMSVSPNPAFDELNVVIGHTPTMNTISATP